MTESHPESENTHGVNGDANARAEEPTPAATDGASAVLARGADRELPSDHTPNAASTRPTERPEPFDRPQAAGAAGSTQPTERIEPSPIVADVTPVAQTEPRPPAAPAPLSAAEQQYNPFTPPAAHERPRYGEYASQQPPLGVAPGAPQNTQPYPQQPPQSPPSGNGTGAFGQPQAPHYAAAPGAVPAATETKRSRVGVGVIAALAIGALIGGTAGAGVMGIWSATQGSSTKTVTSSGPANITVNDPGNATAITAVAAKAAPSVVTIAVTGGNSSGTGSGIVLSKDGYVLTNTHVVTLDGAVADPTIQVTTNDGLIYAATVVGTDPTTDLAVIKLTDATDLVPMEFGDSSALNVGDSAVAIGAPLGLSGTVTDGIVSALNRSITVASSAAPDSSDSGSDPGSGSGSAESPWNFDIPGQGSQDQQKSATSSISLPVIQTDAAINPGNSGGALLNSDGELIGVNVAIASASSSSDSSSQSGSIGVGFAIPSNLAKRVSDEIIKNGSATHGLLGATITDSTSDSSATTVGALVDSVTAGGAAEAAGLKKGDIITNVADVPITSSTDLTAQVRSQAAGAKVTVTFVRGGDTKSVDVTLGSLPAS